MRMIDFIAKSLQQYIGYSFVQVADGGDAEFPDMVGLVLQKGQKRVILWVLKDTEGNGAGFVEAQEL